MLRFSKMFFVNRFHLNNFNNKEQWERKWYKNQQHGSESDEVCKHARSFLALSLMLQQYFKWIDWLHKGFDPFRTLILHHGCWITECNYNWINLQIEVLLILIRFLNRGSAIARTWSTVLITIHGKDLLYGDSGRSAGWGMILYGGCVSVARCILRLSGPRRPHLQWLYITSASTHHHSTAPSPAPHQHHCTSKSHLQPNIFIGSL